MATIVIDIPDPQAVRVRDGLCGYGGWTAESGLTQTQFAKKQAAQLIKDAVRAFEVSVARAAAEAASAPDVT